uniref:Uncharacterized protein n=1 Tax=Rhizophora mucronata TaxID=61149 RepID=A0A2P2M9A5_RHIMU
MQRKEEVGVGHICKDPLL